MWKSTMNEIERASESGKEGKKDLRNFKLTYALNIIINSGDERAQKGEGACLTHVQMENVTARRERQKVEQGQKEQARTTIFTDDNLCVVCGKVYVPEGRWVCPLCEQKYSERSNI